MPLPGFLHGGSERRKDFEDVTDDAIVRDLEDGRFLVLVDGDDRPGGAHAGNMLDGATDSRGDVELRAHLTPRLADLVAVRTPSIVGHCARRANGRVAERVSEILDQLEVV